jgi:hypothetical protein
MATDMPKSAFQSDTMAFYTFLIITKTKTNEKLRSIKRS